MFAEYVQTKLTLHFYHIYFSAWSAFITEYDVKKQKNEFVMKWKHLDRVEIEIGSFLFKIKQNLHLQRTFLPDFLKILKEIIFRISPKKDTYGR